MYKLRILLILIFKITLDHRWDHSDLFHTRVKLADELDIAERIVDINLKDETYEFMSGHVIDGRTLLPATGYLFLVWETFSILKKKFYYNISVVFEDVKFLRPTYLRQQDNIELIITIQQGKYLNKTLMFYDISGALIDYAMNI